jgi:hypothetical protein
MGLFLEGVTRTCPLQAGATEKARRDTELNFLFECHYLSGVLMDFSVVRFFRTAKDLWCFNGLQFLTIHFFYLGTFRFQR